VAVDANVSMAVMHTRLVTCEQVTGGDIDRHLRLGPVWPRCSKSMSRAERSCVWLVHFVQPHRQAVEVVSHNSIMPSENVGLQMSVAIVRTCACGGTTHMGKG
jgi:hypothetical protein